VAAVPAEREIDGLNTLRNLDCGHPDWVAGWFSGRPPVSPDSAVLIQVPAIATEAITRITPALRLQPFNPGL